MELDCTTLPPMFNVTQLSALAAQTRAKAIVGFGGEKEIAKCEQVAPLLARMGEARVSMPASGLRRS